MSDQLTVEPGAVQQVSRGLVDAVADLDRLSARLGGLEGQVASAGAAARGALGLVRSAHARLDGAGRDLDGLRSDLDQRLRLLLSSQASGGAADSSPLDTVREWGADRLSQAASAWSGLGSRVRETEDALGAWKDQVVADHPLELRIAGQVTDAALAASQTPTAANCDQAKVEAAEANATAARDPSLEHDVTAAQADAAEIAACLPQGMAQTSLRTPEGFEVQGPASPFDKGGWDSLLNNHDLLQRDDAGPGKLSPSSDGVGEADAQPAESTETVPPQATAAGQPATPGSNTAANALKAARATPEEVEAWAAGLQTQDTPARTPNDLYERAQTGTVNYLIKGGGTQVWADGVRAADAHVLEAKYIDNPARSPYIAGSACPPFVREAAQAQADKEFQRYAAVLADPNNPVHEMEVITSDKRAVAFFNGLLKKYQIRGRVVVRPPNV